MVKRTKTFVPGAGLPAAEKKPVVAGAPARAPGAPAAPATNGITEDGQNRQDIEAIKVTWICTLSKKDLSEEIYCAALLCAVSVS